MIDIDILLIFIPIAVALNLTPGADMLFCLGQGTKSGPRAGLAASLGIAAGSFIHALAGGLGLAALIAAHPVAFEVIRWAGVVYLLWLARTIWTNPAGELSPAKVSSSGLFKAWREGVVVSLLNPKVAVFMIALVPQFVEPSRGSVLLQFLIFGTVLNIGGTIINGFVGFFAGQIGRSLERNENLSRLLQYLTSFIFVGLATKLAFERR
jgi:threonine/homoserine/homoserine lactone efflux protein